MHLTVTLLMRCDLKCAHIVWLDDIVGTHNVSAHGTLYQVVDIVYIAT